MTYAIVETGGKQLWVEPGRFYDIERIPEAKEDSILDLSQVLLVNHEGQVTLGHPYVSEAVVKARVLQHRRGTKVIVYKMRPKKKTRRKKGHRQELTRVLIEAIEFNGVAIASAKPVAEPASPVEASGGSPGDGE